MIRETDPLPPVPDSSKSDIMIGGGGVGRALSSRSDYQTYAASINDVPDSRQASSEIMTVLLSNNYS